MAGIIKDETKRIKLFIFAPKQKRSLVGMFVKNLFLIVVSLLICGATLYSAQNSLNLTEQDNYISPVLRPAGQEINVNSYGVETKISTDYPINAGDIISTGDGQVIILDLTKDSYLKLDQNTVIKIINFNQGSKTYQLSLDTGKLWGNTKYDDVNLTINTEFASIKPQNSSFNISYDGTITDIFSYSHDLFVSVNYNSEEINSFWLAEGTSVSIPNTKVTQKYDTIKKLLYSKLLKEFNYGRVSLQAIFADSWLNEQSKYDDDYSLKLKDEDISSIRGRGLSSVSTQSIGYQLRSFMSDVKNLLTISSDKKILQSIDLIFSNFNDAEYLLLQNNSIDANIRLGIFKEDLFNPAFLQNEEFNKQLFLRLKTEFRKKLLYNAADALYPLKAELYIKLLDSSMIKYFNDSERFSILTDKLNDVSDSADSNPDEAFKVLIDYFKFYNKIIVLYKDKLQTVSDQIKRQNILVDNILSTYPELYKLEIFENKKTMELNYIGSLQGSDDKKEQRQTFISNKIDLLSKIKYYLFDDLVSVEDAQQIVYLLIQDIEEMKKDTLDIAAVNNLFEKRLSDFGVFWRYLNSPEYSTTPLHGATHQERFEAFKKLQQELVTFQDVQNEILGTGSQEEVKNTVEGILEQAEKDLNNAGIQDVEFGYYNDINQTRIPILKAKTNGIEFRGTYDWDRKLVANIMVSEKLISSEGVKLENAGKFIAQALSSQVSVPQQPQQGAQEPADPQATVKNAAKVFIVEKFSKTDMVITKASISIIDFENGQYEIKDVYYKDNSQAKFSFGYKSKEDKIYSLKIQTSLGEKEVTDTFLSAFLKPVVLKIYDEAKPSA